MTDNAELEAMLNILVCPETHGALAVADDALIARVNAAIEAGGVKNEAGEPVTAPLEAGFTREDGVVLYPVRDGIPNFHIPDRLLLATLNNPAD